MSTSRPRRAAAPVSQQSTPARLTRAASSAEPASRSTRRQAASRKVSYADVQALSDPDDEEEEDDVDIKDEEMDVDEPEDDAEDADEHDEEAELEPEEVQVVRRPRGRPKGKKTRKGGRALARERLAREQAEREGTEMEGEDGEDVPEVSLNGTRKVRDEVFQLEEGGESCVLPDDEKGDAKVDEKGNLLGGRQWKIYTFKCDSRHDPNKLYVLSIDAARACGFEASLVLYRRYPALIKLSVNQKEKERLIDAGKVSTNLKHRSVTMTPARNVFRLLGARLVQGGKWVTDDYYEDAALEQCKADGLEPYTLVGDLDPEQSAPAQPGQNILRSLGISSAFSLGAPSTQFGGSGLIPWIDAGLGNKRAKLISSGVTQQDWMYRMAAEARAREKEMRAEREARLRVFNARENNKPVWTYATEHANELSQKERAKAEESSEEGTRPVEGSRAPKKRKLWSAYEPGVVRGLYEPHTHTPHVPKFTQASGARFERLDEFPRLGPSAPRTNVRSVLVGAVVGPGAVGITSVEYALEAEAVAQATQAERLAQIQAAEDWQTGLKQQRLDVLEARAATRRGTASQMPSTAATPRVLDSRPATPVIAQSPGVSDTTGTLQETLLAHLKLAFTRLPNPEALHITSYVSRSKRTNSLFPHAVNPPKCWEQDFLVTVTSDLKGGNQVSNSRVLVAGVSATLYYLPQTSSSVLYISKIDSSGASPIPLPVTRVLARAFIGYFLNPETRRSLNVWVQLFARASPQYLFANSSESGSKKNLTGLGLCLWWKRVLEDVVLEQEWAAGSLQLAYLLPSYSAAEAQGMVGQPKRSLPAGVTWQYLPPGDASLPSPYAATASADHPLGISNLIPSFPDDAKTRFLDELVAELPIHPPRDSHRDDQKRKSDDAAYRGVASRALDAITAREFWERMGFRQECASGDVTGFFSLGVLSEYPTSSAAAKNPPVNATELSPAIFERIAQALRNFDFGSRDLAIDATAGFEALAKRIVTGEVGEEAWASAYEVQVPAKADVSVLAETIEREKEAAPPVMVLQARKKKK